MKYLIAKKFQQAKIKLLPWSVPGQGHFTFSNPLTRQLLISSKHGARSSSHSQKYQQASARESFPDKDHQCPSGRPLLSTAMFDLSLALVTHVQETIAHRPQTMGPAQPDPVGYVFASTSCRLKIFKQRQMKCTLTPRLLFPRTQGHEKYGLPCFFEYYINLLKNEKDNF